MLGSGIFYLRISRTSVLYCLLLPALIVVALGHAFLWIGNHWARSKEDILASFFYADRAHNFVLPPHEQIQALRGRNAPQNWPDMSRLESIFGFLAEARCWAQILATIGLAAGVWLAQNLPPLHS
jgi:hypothetical protein